MKRKKIAEKRRREIFDEFNNFCVYCGDRATSIDHLRPYSYDQNNQIDNLVPACEICNSIASNKHFSSFEEKIKYVQKRREQKGLFTINFHAFFDGSQFEINELPTEDIPEIGYKVRSSKKALVEKRKYRPLKRPRFIEGETEDAQLIKELLNKLRIPPYRKSFKYLALFLSIHADKKPLWGENYISSVYRGTLKASDLLREVVRKYIANINFDASNFRSSDIRGLKIKLIELLKENTYQEAANIFGVSKALIWKIVNTDYEPRSSKIREKLQLPPIPNLIACSTCGDDFFPNVPWRVKCFKCRKPRIVL